MAGKICPNCGAYVSVRLDACPACGMKTQETTHKGGAAYAAKPETGTSTPKGGAAYAARPEHKTSTSENSAGYNAKAEAEASTAKNRTGYAENREYETSYNAERVRASVQSAVESAAQATATAVNAASQAAQSAVSYAAEKAEKAIRQKTEQFNQRSNYNGSTYSNRNTAGNTASNKANNTNAHKMPSENKREPRSTTFIDEYGEKITDYKRLLAIASYFGPVWIASLILKGDSPYVRSHANQGMLLFLAEIILKVAGNIVPFGGWAIDILRVVMGIICMVIGIKAALKYQRTELPLIGGIHLIDGKN